MWRFLALLLLATPAAQAADSAQSRAIGFSPDGRYFAFEQYGIQDGSGFGYSDIFILDIEQDRWVPGTPVQVLIEDESTHIDEARKQANQKAQPLITQFKADGIERGAVTLLRFGDLRYVGQGYELRVAFPADGLDDAGLEGVWSAFHEQHKREYGHFFADSPIEIVNIRVTGIGVMPKIGKPEVSAGRSIEAALVRRGQSVFRVGGVLKPYETAYYRRDQLPLGQAVPGPAIILQRDTTTVVPPGWSAESEAGGNLILRVTRKG